MIIVLLRWTLYPTAISRILLTSTVYEGSPSASIVYLLFFTIGRFPSCCPHLRRVNKGRGVLEREISLTSAGIRSTDEIARLTPGDKRGERHCSA